MRPFRRAAAFTLQLLLLQLLLLGGRGACEREMPTNAPTNAPSAGIATKDTEACDHESLAPMHHQTPAGPAQGSLPGHDRPDGSSHCVTMATCAADVASWPTAVSATRSHVVTNGVPQLRNQRAPLTWRGAPEPPPLRT